MPSWPLQWGGGPEPVEQQLDALRTLVGRGHAATEDGPEQRWREARAEGLAMAAGLAERAASQMYPGSSPELAFFRRMFDIPDTDNDQQAREAANGYELGAYDGVLSRILLHLKTIDSRFRLLTVEPDETTVTMAGRTVAPEDGTQPFNLGPLRRETVWPNYSDAFDVAFVLELEDGEGPGETERRAFGTARRYLTGAMPAWSTWYLVTHIGFSSSLSLLDLAVPDVTP
jgi:hypothetical protein